MGENLQSTTLLLDWSQQFVAGNSHTLRLLVALPNFPYTSLENLLVNHLLVQILNGVLDPDVVVRRYALRVDLCHMSS